MKPQDLSTQRSKMALPSLQSRYKHRTLLKVLEHTNFGLLALQNLFMVYMCFKGKWIEPSSKTCMHRLPPTIHDTKVMPLQSTS